MKRVFAQPVLLALAAILADCSAEPAASQPNMIDIGDEEYPPMSVSHRIDSDQIGLNAWMYLASGEGPHPFVVFMHGYPGNERNLDVAQAVRRAGFNALFFSYRRSWGTGGTFSWDNALEDGLAAVAFVKSQYAADSLRADTSRVYLFGHSFGAWVAASTAASMSSVSGLAVMGLWNVGKTGALMHDGVYGEADMSWFGAAFDDISGPLKGNPAQLLKELEIDHARLEVIQNWAPRLNGPVLIISTTQDEQRQENNTEALVNELEKNGVQFKRYILPDDHEVSVNRLWLSEMMAAWLQRTDMN